MIVFSASKSKITSKNYIITKRENLIRGIYARTDIIYYVKTLKNRALRTKLANNAASKKKPMGIPFVETRCGKKEMIEWVKNYCTNTARTRIMYICSRRSPYPTHYRKPEALKRSLLYFHRIFIKCHLQSKHYTNIYSSG